MISELGLESFGSLEVWNFVCLGVLFLGILDVRLFGFGVVWDWEFWGCGVLASRAAQPPWQFFRTLVPRRFQMWLRSKIEHDANFLDLLREVIVVQSE